MDNYLPQSENTSGSDEKINRKEALKKAGKYAAFTAAAMLIILSPQKSVAQSQPVDQGPALPYSGS